MLDIALLSVLITRCELLVDGDHAFLTFPWPTKPTMRSASPVVFQLIFGNLEGRAFWKAQESFRCYIARKRQGWDLKSSCRNCELHTLPSLLLSSLSSGTVSPLVTPSTTGLLAVPCPMIVGHPWSPLRDSASVVPSLWASLTVLSLCSNAAASQRPSWDEGAFLPPVLSSYFTSSQPITTSCEPDTVPGSGGLSMEKIDMVVRTYIFKVGKIKNKTRIRKQDILRSRDLGPPAISCCDILAPC